MRREAIQSYVFERFNIGTFHLQHVSITEQGQFPRHDFVCGKPSSQLDDLSFIDHADLLQFVFFHTLTILSRLTKVYPPIANKCLSQGFR